MQKKRGQITAFIIIGLIILISAFLFLYLRKQTQEKSETLTPADINPIKLYVDSSINMVVERGIYFICLQGGYYDVPNPVDYSFIKIPYYFYLGNQSFPEKETIENEFSKYVEQELPAYINNFEVFKQIGYEFETGNIRVDSSLGKTLNIKINYPITIKKDESTATIQDFYYSKDFNFDGIYNILSDFASEHQKNPDFVPIGHLSVLAYKNNFTYNLAYSSNNTVVYSFIFNDSLEKNQNLVFNFASRYNWSELNQAEMG